jgi:hypothetical protein
MSKELRQLRRDQVLTWAKTHAYPGVEVEMNCDGDLIIDTGHLGGIRIGIELTGLVPAIRTCEALLASYGAYFNRDRHLLNQVLGQIAEHPNLPCPSDEVSLNAIPGLLAVLLGSVEHAEDYRPSLME